MSEESKLSREVAEELYDSRWWEDETDQEIIAFQLFEPRLCMPFKEYHRAIESVLGRPVWTHEFAFSEQLQKEYLTQRPPMSLDESLSRLQEEFPHLKIITVDVKKDDYDKS